MPDDEKEIIRDPKYDPPYPQEFDRFWPRHALKAIAVVVITFAIIVALAWFYRVPTDFNMPPLPDDGAYIPGPEWYLIFIFQPFWYLTGELVKWRSIGTFWIPVTIVVAGVILPFVFGRKRASGKRLPTFPKVIMGIGALAIWGLMTMGVVGSSYPAKTTGCISCHNPMMGVRQALPPPDMAKFYREGRKQQISVGRYRVGSATGSAQSYKDANWQLRHYYEPTMTW